MKDFTIILIIIISILLIIGIPMAGFTFLDKYIYCPNFGKATQLEIRYVIFGGGCFVKTEKGQWVQGQNYWNSVIK